MPWIVPFEKIVVYIKLLNKIEVYEIPTLKIKKKINMSISYRHSSIT